MNATEMDALAVHLKTLKLDQTGQPDVAYYARRGRHLQARAVRRAFANALRGVAGAIAAAIHWHHPAPGKASQI